MAGMRECLETALGYDLPGMGIRMQGVVMGSSVDWKAQHPKCVVMASLALGAVICLAPSVALADAQGHDADAHVEDSEITGLAENDAPVETTSLAEIDTAGFPSDEGGVPACKSEPCEDQTDSTDTTTLPAQSKLSPVVIDMPGVDAGATGANGSCGLEASSTQDGQAEKESPRESAADSSQGDGADESGTAETGAADAENSGDAADGAATVKDPSPSPAEKDPGAGAHAKAAQAPSGNTAADTSESTADMVSTAPLDSAPQTDAEGNADDTTPAQTNAPAPSAQVQESTPKLTGWQSVDGHKYYYGKDGRPVTGTQTISGKTYLFNAKGQLQAGFCHVGNNVVSYFDPTDGHQLTGRQFIHAAWRNLDSGKGLLTGLTDVKESGQTNTYLYDSFDGSAQTGQQYVNGSWHYFDEDTGRMYTREQEAQRIVDFALAEVGGSESKAFTYLDEVAADGGSYCGYGPCMATVRHIFKAAGMSMFLADGFVDSWPHKYLDLMTAKGQHGWTPRIGEVAFFLWQNSFARQIGVSADHAEIVIEVGPGWYKTVGAVSGGVLINTYYTAGDYNIGFGIPAFWR